MSPEMAEVRADLEALVSTLREQLEMAVVQWEDLRQERDAQRELTARARGLAVGAVALLRGLVECGGLGPSVAPFIREQVAEMDEELERGAR